MRTVREIRPKDKEIIVAILQEHWGEQRIVSRGKTYDAASLPGFVVEDESQIEGLVTYNLTQDECEIVSLNALSPTQGIGSLLIERVVQHAKKAGCRRIWLVTTNDNLHALRFYQRRGFQLVDVYRNALDVSRKLKPTIPLVGEFGIPLRDEIELELILGAN
jgi:N-acetylglutamate synthase-like GNAT family acetyltransferase